jgi:quercetin dioxygenase-like cupin family protein
MKTLSRRSALVLGGAAAVIPIAAEAQTSYGHSDGKEVAPGVRAVQLSEKASKVPGFKMVMLRDFVFQPGSKGPSNTMKNAMVCHCLDGELQITQEDGAFAAKKGTVWTCKAGGTESAENKGSTVAIMRIVDLMT